MSRSSPGPDCKLYLSPEFVETEAEFHRVRPRMVRVADVKTNYQERLALFAVTGQGDLGTANLWCMFLRHGR